MIGTSGRIRVLIQYSCFLSVTSSFKKERGILIMIGTCLHGIELICSHMLCASKKVPIINTVKDHFEVLENDSDVNEEP